MPVDRPVRRREFGSLYPLGLDVREDPFQLVGAHLLPQQLERAWDLRRRQEWQREERAHQGVHRWMALVVGRQPVLLHLAPNALRKVEVAPLHADIREDLTHSIPSS